MTTNREALLPCPFCGGEARSLPALSRVFCTMPECNGEMSAMTRSGAITAWNTRAPPSEPSEALDCVGLAIIKGKEVTVTFDNHEAAFAFFNELEERAALNQPEQEI